MSRRVLARFSGHGSLIYNVIDLIEKKIYKTFVSVLKFQYFAQFPVHDISHPAMSVIIFLFYSSIAFPYVINHFISITIQITSHNLANLLYIINFYFNRTSSEDINLCRSYWRFSYNTNYNLFRDIGLLIWANSRPFNISRQLGSSVQVKPKTFSLYDYIFFFALCFVYLLLLLFLFLFFVVDIILSPIEIIPFMLIVVFINLFFFLRIFYIFNSVFCLFQWNFKILLPSSLSEFDQKKTI